MNEEMLREARKMLYKVYYDLYRDKSIKRAKEWQENNKERYLQRHKKWASNNREGLNEYNRKYSKENREIKNVIQRKYRAKYRDIVNEKQRDYRKKKGKQDICLPARSKSLAGSQVKRSRVYKLWNSTIR